MNSVERAWLNWTHSRKFARVGKGSQFPILFLTVEGHVELGDRCRFRNNATFRTHGDGKIIFAPRSGCSWGVYIEASNLVEIGTYTAIAEYSVVTDTCISLWGNGENWRKARRVGKPVKIGDNCFVGSGCYIGPGVTIGEGAVVATHSIVTRDIGPYEIWSGAPARFVGHRTKDIPEAKLREYQELIARYGFKPDRYKDQSSTQLHRFRAITFDFWGTLFRDVDAELREQLRIQHFCELTGCDRAVVEVALKDAHKEFFRCHVEEQRTLGPADAVRITCGTLGVVMDEATFEFATQGQAEAILTYPPALIDDALEAVQAAAARFPVALICDSGVSPGSSLTQLLDRHGFTMLKVRTFSDEVGVAKPQRLMFEVTAAALGVKPEDLLHIGDLQPTDIVGVQAVGGTGALFAGSNARFWDKTTAEHRFRTWREFVDWLATV